MYQSFPQRRMCFSNNAMPVVKNHNNNFCEDIKNDIKKIEDCNFDKKNCKNTENEKILNNNHMEKCEDVKSECCDEKNLSDNKNPLSALFGDLFKNIEIDDLILIGLILFLLYEGEDDIIIIGILALILFL